MSGVLSLGSSSLAKYALAALRISFARRSSRTSRSSSVIRCLSPVVVPVRWPPSISVCFSQPRNASGWTPSWRPTRAISPRPLPSRSRTSSTIFTARSRSSSGYFFCAATTLNPPRYQSLQPSRGDPVQLPSRRCPGRDQPAERFGHPGTTHHMHRPQRPGPEDQRRPERGVPPDITCQLPGKLADHGRKDALGRLVGALIVLLARLPGEPVRQRGFTCVRAARVPAAQGCLVSVLHRRHSLPHRGQRHGSLRSWLSCPAAYSRTYAHLRP